MKKLVTFSLIISILMMLGFWVGWISQSNYSAGLDYRHQAAFDKLEFMLLQYHVEHGAFPPTKYQPLVGGPVHSWRVLLMLRLGLNPENGAHGYDFSKEWNNTDNIRFFEKSLSQHYFTSARDGSRIAQFLAIGEDDEWPAGKKPLRSRLIRSGKDTFLLVEYPSSNVHWMEPAY